VVQQQLKYYDLNLNKAEKGKISRKTQTNVGVSDKLTLWDLLELNRNIAFSESGCWHPNSAMIPI
jgi:hypothetical protein